MSRALLDYVTAPLLQTASLRERGHRPWPLPRRPWVMGQSWLDLLFAHWRVPAEALRPHVPEALPLDRFDGDTWLGLTPFEVAGLRPSLVPPIPGISRFPELNVRTYVALGGKPGIFFFSLDADSDLAVAAARRFYRLPYQSAQMRIDRTSTRVVFSSSRRGDGARFGASYRPHEPLPQAEKTTLESFLTERYCLYTVDAGHVYRAEIHHPPWPLHQAAAELSFEGLLPAGINVRPDDALLHYSPRQDVLVWGLERVARDEPPAR